MRRPLAAVWTFAGLLLAPGPLRAQTQLAVAPNDYTADANWLCRPGRHDACDVDMTTSVVAADPRTDDISGDYISRGQLQRDWGLHLVDMNLVLGNLIGVVREQARAFAGKK